MKSLSPFAFASLVTSAIAAVMLSPFIYNSMGAQTCTTHYDLSFNGLYLLKIKTCVGPLNMETTSETIARQPRFEEF